MARQMLKSQRPFTVYVLGPNGESFFKVKNQLQWAGAKLHVYIYENGQERLIGQVRGHTTPWERKFDLYEGGLNMKHFATVNGRLFGWTFPVRNERKELRACAERIFRSYVIHALC